MKNMLFMMVLFCVSSLAGQARNVNANSFDDSLRSEADKLLTEWMDAFLASTLVPIPHLMEESCALHVPVCMDV